MWRRAPLAAVLFALALPAAASADIVKLSNGRTMRVESCVFDGSVVILRLLGGGEVQASRDLVAEVLPDEVPYSRTVAIEALAASPAAARNWSPDVIHGLIDRFAREVGVDRRLAHAVVRTESNYEPFAVSSRGAMGLMQIMPVIAREYGVEDPFDPEQNLKAGMQHLRRLLGRFDTRRALAAYNAGESVVVRYGGVPPYRETQSYVQRILAAVR